MVSPCVRFEQERMHASLRRCFLLTVHAVRLFSLPSALHGPLSECGCPDANVDDMEHHRSVPGAGTTTALAKFPASSASTVHIDHCHCLPELLQQLEVPIRSPSCRLKFSCAQSAESDRRVGRGRERKRASCCKC